MRICFASEYYPPFAPGGAEWSTKALAESLARRGHRVVVVTPNYGAAPVEEAGGVTVIRFPFPLRLKKGQGEAPWLVHRNPLLYRYFAWHLGRIGRRERSDVLHAQGKAALVPAWRASRLLGRPVVVTIRDLGFLCPLGMCPLFKERAVHDCDLAQYRSDCIPYFLGHYQRGEGALRRLVRRWRLVGYWADHRLRQTALRRADLVIGVSRGILDVYPERVVGAGRSRVVHTPAPRVEAVTAGEVAAVRGRYDIAEGSLVLYAGKLSVGKGTDVFLEALDGIRAKVPGVRFALAGKGEWPIPKAPDIHHLGSVPQPDLFRLYAGAEVVVVPSVWPEPLSRVILEAMAFGRPVVATAVGGSPEQVEDGVTGLLVPKRDAAGLAGAVSNLLLDPERRKRMGAAARRRAVTAFDEDRLAGELLDAYRGAGVAP